MSHNVTSEKIFMYFNYENTVGLFMFAVGLPALLLYQEHLFLGFSKRVCHHITKC